MSSGLNCELIETERNRWYYVLEDGTAPKNAWDWREHAKACGPFPSRADAASHLKEHHANPGGTTTLELPAGQEALDLTKDSILSALIADAVAPHALRMRWR